MFTTITKQRHRTGGVVPRLAAVGLLAVGLIGATTGPAQAVAGFHTSGAGVRVRAAATTQSAQVSSIPVTGTALDIACQIGGETLTAAGFGTSAVWDKLNGYGNGYISDLFVRETAYAQFDPRIPRCATTPLPPPPPPTFHTSGAGVRVRAAATSQSAQVASIPTTGTGISIVCQAAGQTLTAAGFGTSAVWDKLSGYGNGYISDLFVKETSYAQFDPRLPRCAGTPVIPQPATREAKAIAWANGQLGRSLDDWGRATTNWCARWSVGAYGRKDSGYASAWVMYQTFARQGMIRQGTAPAGAFVFFAAARVNGGNGHVAIADGGGGMITTSGTVIRHTPLSFAGAPYLGWSYAPTGWTR